MYNANFEIGLKVPASGAYFTGSQIKLHFHLIGRLCANAEDGPNAVSETPGSWTFQRNLQWA